MKNLQKVNAVLAEIHNLVSSGKTVAYRPQKLKVGLDLGTSSIVLVVLDELNRPLFAATKDANVVRDGLVVDYIGALQISKHLKEVAEKALQLKLTQAAGAIPPGTVGNNKQVIRHIIEGIGLECCSILDEPTAAAKALGIMDGAVVDVGGGTTGISILEKGQVVFAEDEATGGNQMTLVLAGYYGLSIEKGEYLKREKKEVFSILKPVVEKMAYISHNFIRQYGKQVSEVYLVGGATNFEEFDQVFEKELNISIFKPAYPQYVTPLGIAMSME